MHTPQVRAHPKDAHYRIQHPVSGLYARIEKDPPPSPQLAEDSTGSIASHHSAHVKFVERPLATWFDSVHEATTAFAKYLGAAPLEIVRCVP